jgi:hypothetical protein
LSETLYEVDEVGAVVDRLIFDDVEDLLTSVVGGALRVAVGPVLIVTGQ